MKLKFGLLCGAAMLFGASAANAGTLWPGFTGYSYLADPCPLCDSVVNFVVYENTDGNWTDDGYFDSSNVSQNALADLNGQFGASIDSGAKYVYMYQPVNRDNSPSLDNPLADMSVTMRQSYLDNITSAGYFGGVFLGEGGQIVDGNPEIELDMPDKPDGAYIPDIPGDGMPNRDYHNSLGLSLTATSVIDPITVTTGNLVSNPLFPGDFFTAIQYNYGSPGIPTGGSSSTVFFTTNQRPAYSIAETESAGGNGAVGDVPAPVPVPAGMLLMGSGIALAGLYRRFRVGKRSA